MENPAFNKLFRPINESVLNFYKESGVGFCIPDYQREYSWDKDNIDQLLSDITEGVDRLTNTESKEKEIHFLGTIIAVADDNYNQEDVMGKPTRVDKIIDGQQRIITFSLIASVFIKRLSECLTPIEKTSTIYEVQGK